MFCGFRASCEGKTAPLSMRTARRYSQAQKPPTAPSAYSLQPTIDAVMFRLGSRAGPVPVRASAAAKKLGPRPTPGASSPSSAAGPHVGLLISRQASSSTSPQAASGRGPVTPSRLWGAVIATGIASLSLGVVLGSKGDSTHDSTGEIQYASRNTMLKVGVFTYTSSPPPPNSERQLRKRHCTHTNHLKY